MFVGREFFAVGVFFLAVLQLAIVVEPFAVFLHCKFRSGAVHGNLDVFARFITGVFDSLYDAVESILDSVEVRRKSALISDGCAQATAFQQLSKGMEHFGTHTDAFLDRGSANRTNHEFLEGNGSVGVGTAVDDVHHRNGQRVGVAATDVAVERQSESLGGSLCRGKAHAEYGVGTELALGGRAIKGNHLLVKRALCEHAVALQCRCDDFVYVTYGLQHAFAKVALLVAVAKFKGFVFTGGSTRRNSGASHHSVFQRNFYFYRRISTRVEDFPCVNLFNFHRLKFYKLMNKYSQSVGQACRSACQTPARLRVQNYKILLYKKRSCITSDTTSLFFRGR